MPIDFLIVGQGLAGSLLAWELMRRQFRVIVIDSGEQSASQVAAGLINPVTGQRLVKTPNVEQMLQVAMDCYRELAEIFNRQFFVPVPMLKVLKNPSQRALADRRLEEPAYQFFLRNRISDVPGVISRDGLLEQLQTGYLRTRLMLDTLRTHLKSNDAYRKARLDYREIVLQPKLQWRDLRPANIVFCEGYRAQYNPWFGQLPFQPAKGEILDCESNRCCPQTILNFGHWLIPVGERRFKVGATFEPGKTDTVPTERARQSLLQSLFEVCPDLRAVDVVNHQAGIRPTTLDKQPFIGSHPQHPHLHIFNGFGAKGSLVIPWYARRFIEFFKQQESLPHHCNIARYDQTYLFSRNGA